MIGDAMLFNRADGVEAGWEVVQPILDLWQNDKTVPLEIYPAGSAGPEAADTAAVAQRPAMAPARVTAPIAAQPSPPTRSLSPRRTEGARTHGEARAE